MSHSQPKEPYGSLVQIASSSQLWIPSAHSSISTQSWSSMTQLSLGSFLKPAPVVHSAVNGSQGALQSVHSQHLVPSYFSEQSWKLAGQSQKYPFMPFLSLQP